MVAMLSDIHGNIQKFLNDVSVLQLTEKDYVLVLGDFGLIWDKNKTEYERDIYRKLAELKCRILFIDGNHDNIDRLDAMPVAEWNGGKAHIITESIIHLMRGQVYEIEGKRVFCFGGGKSHDVKNLLYPTDPEFDFKKRIHRFKREFFRVVGTSFWERELPSCEEMKEGMKSLEKIGNKVDLILTHCAPSSIQKMLNYNFKDDILTGYLDKIRREITYEKWIFGHYHTDAVIENNHICVYNEVYVVK